MRPSCKTTRGMLSYGNTYLWPPSNRTQSASPLASQPASQPAQQSAQSTSPSAPQSRRGRTAVCLTGHPRSLAAGPFTNLSIDKYGASRHSVRWANEILGHAWSSEHVKHPAAHLHGHLTFASPVGGNLIADSLMANVFTPLAENGGYDLFIIEPGERILIRKDLGPYELLRPMRVTGRPNGLLHAFGGPEPRIQLKTKERWKKYHYVCCDWRRHSGAPAAHLQSLFYQLLHQHACNRMVKAHAAKMGVPYTYKIRLRPDLLVLAPIPPIHTLDFGRPGAPIVRGISGTFLPSWLDKFGIGGADVMDAYLDRLPLLFAMPDLAFVGNWNAEWFLQHVLNTSANATVLTADDVTLKAMVVRLDTHWLRALEDMHKKDYGYLVYDDIAPLIRQQVTPSTVIV